MTNASESTNQDEQEEPKPGPGSGALKVLDHTTGEYREGTQAEYDAEPVGRIFVGIVGFKPPKGQTYKPDPLPEPKKSKSPKAQPK